MSPVAAGITHPEKVLFPDDGITKGEVAAYYASVAAVMLPHVHGRPITMERFPSGIDGKGFLQKNVVKGFPEWLERAELPKKGGTVQYPLANDARSLQWMANQNTITLHVWTSRMPDAWQPDICVFDLDPSADDPEPLRAAALGLRDLLEARGVPSAVKTSGSKGFHIVVPLKDTGFGAVGHFATAVAHDLVARLPELVTLEFSKADRGGRILVDIGRNRPGATMAAAYTVRSRPGAPVSAPCTWDEIERRTVGPRTFTLRTMAERLADVGDLWRDLAARAVVLTARPDGDEPPEVRLSTRGVVRTKTPARTPAKNPAQSPAQSPAKPPTPTPTRTPAKRTRAGRSSGR